MKGTSQNMMLRKTHFRDKQIILTQLLQKTRIIRKNKSSSLEGSNCKEYRNYRTWLCWLWNKNHLTTHFSVESILAAIQIKNNINASTIITEPKCITNYSFCFGAPNGINTSQLHSFISERFLGTHFGASIKISERVHRKNETIWDREREWIVESALICWTCWPTFLSIVRKKANFHVKIKSKMFSSFEMHIAYRLQAKMERLQKECHQWMCVWNECVCVCVATIEYAQKNQRNRQLLSVDGRALFQHKQKSSATYTDIFYINGNHLVAIQEYSNMVCISYMWCAFTTHVLVKPTIEQM